jgi:hypothetical protein
MYEIWNDLLLPYSKLPEETLTKILLQQSVPSSYYYYALQLWESFGAFSTMTFHLGQSWTCKVRTLLIGFENGATINILCEVTPV